MRAVDKRRGYRRPTRNVLAEGHQVDAFKDERWSRPIAAGDIVPAIVASLETPLRRQTARGCASGPTPPISRRRASPGRGGPAASSLFKTGDLIEVQIVALDADERARRRCPSSSARCSRVRSSRSTTGPDRSRPWSAASTSARSKFNRAVQAFRQLGSTFKPVVYTAAIDRGYTPASVIVDEPVVYPSGSGVPYSPQNYDHKFEGQVTLRRSLEQSRNIPAIKVMDAIGPKNVVDYAKRFGFSQEFPPYLPIALGAGDGTLLEVDERLHGVSEPGRADAAASPSSRSPIATATCWKRTAPSQSTSSARTPPS